MSFRRLSALALLAGLLAWPGNPQGLYDPLSVETSEAARYIDVSARDERRDRALPLRIYLPSSNAPAPVILFSHGLGGSREGSAYLGEHWSARGYVVVYVQHPGSDEDVWKTVKPRERMAAMKQAGIAQNSRRRFEDVGFVIDTLERWNGEAGNSFFNRLDLTRIGMSGHSFGARTTQVAAGQSLPGLGTRYSDPRIDAALPMSPSSQNRILTPEQQFRSVDLPWLLMTGTQDTAAIGGETGEGRLAVFDALPPGSKYELVLFGGQHHAFTDGELRRGLSPRDPDHHRVILALSTAFWDAYLRDDAGARAWLDGNGPTEILDSRDGWDRK